MPVFFLAFFYRSSGFWVSGSRMANETRLFEKADYLLMRIDEHHEELIFRPVSQTMIRNAPFLDDSVRYPGSQDQFRVPISKALDWQAGTIAQPPKLIIHTAYCGSTLLANMLANMNEMLVYKEPAVLSSLMSLKAENHKLTHDPALWQNLIRFVLIQLQKSWNTKPALIKPSNWINPLIPDLQAAAPDLRLQVITTDLESFLLASLRGGRDRLQYTLSLLNHLLAAGQVDRSRVLEVEQGGLSPLQRLLRLLSIVHNTQQTWLSRISPRSDWIHHDDLRISPEVTMTKAALNLDLPLKSETSPYALEEELNQNAKTPGTPFDSQHETSENLRLRNEFREELAEALSWSAAAQ